MCADPVSVDVFDAQALRAAVSEAAPEVVVHELTSLSKRFESQRKDPYDATNRVRSEGTRMATGLCEGDRRQAAAPSAALAGPADSRRLRGRDEHHTGRRLERQGQVRTGLAASLVELS
jgi:hypothetical protein